MRGTTYSQKTKERAASLRAAGLSYGNIKKKLGVPTSTLATWLAHSPANVSAKENQLAHLERIRPLAAAARRKQRTDRLACVAQSVHSAMLCAPIHDIHFKKSLLAMLYWAEGSKYKGVTGVRFTNTDPLLMQLYVSLLRECYNIDSNKFRMRLQLHYYHNKTEAKNFWTTKLSIPLERCTATALKKRSRKKHFRQNYMGICFLFYPDSSIREEILAIGTELNLIYSAKY